MSHLNQFSVVVPFFNEAENAEFVLTELREVLPGTEIIGVDDGSTDDTWAAICRVPAVRRLRFSTNLGQSAAIYYGLKATTAPVCGLIDGDGQNDPRSFAAMLEVLHRTGVDVVCGYRAQRHDSFSRRAASRVANNIRRAFLHDGVRDTGCTQKVFRREAIELLVPFRGMHRYLPALFRQGGLQIAEVAVGHRARRAGTSKYGNWSRGIAGVYDLIGVQWLLRRKFMALNPKALENNERSHFSNELLR
jgi:dolichol-phosphate mannosyltransferase